MSINLSPQAAPTPTVATAIINPVPSSAMTAFRTWLGNNFTFPSGKTANDVIGFHITVDVNGVSQLEVDWNA